MDDTPIDWSSLSPLHHQQQQQQQQQQQHQQATSTTMSMSSSPVVTVNRTRKAPSCSFSSLPSLSPSEAAEMPPSRSMSMMMILGPKRARLGGGRGRGLQQEKTSSASDRGSSTVKPGKGQEAAGGSCSFRWSEGGTHAYKYQRGLEGDDPISRQHQHQRSGTCSVNGNGNGNGSQSVKVEDGNQRHGRSSEAGLVGRGGGISATHPSGMDMVVGGDRYEARPTSEDQYQNQCVLNPDGGIGVCGGGGGYDHPGGGAVISSGFGAGGFPKHQWYQDQGGSSDDMLILYGSPS